MPRRAPIRQADLTSIAEGMRAAGCDGWRAEFDPATGKWSVWHGRAAADSAPDPTGANPCDELLR